MGMKPQLKTLALSILVASTSASAGKTNIQTELGEALFQDTNFSINRNQSCESCHTIKTVTVDGQTASPFVDPDNVADGSPVSEGSIEGVFGGLNAPSAAYAAFSPDFHWDEEAELFIGGQFWNGRAVDLVAQAKGPFLNPGEMALTDVAQVAERLREKRKYKKMLESMGVDTSNDQAVFQAIAEAIAAFEKTRFFNRFDSKFDFVEAGEIDYTEAEQRGADISDQVCGTCHAAAGPVVNGMEFPMLTDFSYDNIGVPANPAIKGAPDPGLLGNPATEEGPAHWKELEGRHKVMTLRNIAVTPPYMHNGVFQTLEQVVHFYNTRDVLPTCSKPADATNEGFGTDCWPLAEFPHTQSMEPGDIFDDSAFIGTPANKKGERRIGDLGLSEKDEADLVAYLKTFTDNYPNWGIDVPRRTLSPLYSLIPQAIEAVND